MISCFLVVVAMRSQRQEKECPDILFVSSCLFWKMGRKGSLSFMGEILFEMTLKLCHTICDIFNDKKQPESGQDSRCSCQLTGVNIKS